MIREVDKLRLLLDQWQLPRRNSSGCVR